MNALEVLIIALVLDAIIGDPKFIWERIPHPAMIMGQAIDWCDRKLNLGSGLLLKGGLVMLALVIIAYLVGYLIVLIPDYDILEVAIVTILLAHKDLIRHVRNVAIALDSGVDSARKALSQIVGRDTSELDESSICRGAIESAAENFSDGVVAPAFWYLTFGLPGMLVYKMVNTADSMIGYLNEKYAMFGKAAARLDDLMNWIPARLTGAVMCMVGRKRGAWEIMREEAQFHRSPNAGWPEAAMAASLGIALAGPRTYEGKLSTDAFINGSARRALKSKDIYQANGILWRCWFAILFCLLVAAGVLFIA